MASGSDASTAFPRTRSATATSESVRTRRHWYGTGQTCCAFTVMPTKMAMYAAAVEIAAPIIP